MFFDALIAALQEDGKILGVTILILLIAMFTVLFCQRKKNFAYFSEFNWVFFSIGITWIIAGAAFLAVNLLWLQNSTVPFNTVKADKKELRSVILKDYKDALSKADTAAKREALKNKYINNGYTIDEAGQLKILQTSQVSKDILDWINIRERMEKGGNYVIYIPDIQKASPRPKLGDRVNEKAIQFLNLMRTCRFYFWGGAIAILSIIMFIIGLMVGQRGTKEKIEAELETM